MLLVSCHIRVSFSQSVYVWLCETVQLYNQQLLHATYKLYITSLAYEVAHLFVDVVVYGKYANDGINYYGGITFGAYLRLWDNESVAVLLPRSTHC